MTGPKGVRDEVRGAGLAPKIAVRPAVPPSLPAAAPLPSPRKNADRFGGSHVAPVDENQKLAELVKVVAAKTREGRPAEPTSGETEQAEGKVAGGKPSDGTATASGAGLLPGDAGPRIDTPDVQDSRDGYIGYQPPQVQRPIYTGGAPALKPEQMDAAVIKNNLLLRGLYALQDRAPWLLKAYQGFTRVAGPIGAWLNLGYNAISARRILADPRAPMFLKGSIVGSTALAGVSAAAATRVGLHAFNVWPMAAEGAKLAGKVAGVAGLGSATLLSAMDTFNTFRDPNSTAAEKGFSLLGTGASAGLTVAVLMGVTGPVGIALGIGAVAFTLAKGFLGKNKYANAVFETIGKGVSQAADAVVGAAKAVGNAIGDAVGTVTGGLKKVFSGW